MDEPMGEDTMLMKIFVDTEYDEKEHGWPKFWTVASITAFICLVLAPVISIIVFFIYGHHLFPDLIP